jgi:hypothetical protein
LLRCATRLDIRVPPKLRFLRLIIPALVALPIVTFAIFLHSNSLYPLALTVQGTVKLRNEAESAVAMLNRLQSLAESDPIFFYPHLSIIPYLTNRVHSGPVDLFVPGYTTPVQYDEACRKGVSQARWVLWETRRDSDAYRAGFPRMRDPAPPERVRRENAIRASSEIVGQYDGFELRRVEQSTLPCKANDELSR